MIRSVRVTGSVTPQPDRVARSRSKRVADVILATIALILLAPFLILVCVAIIVDSDWPPLFAQERVGLLGRTFRMWKFRTMTHAAETLRRPLLERNEAPFPVFKLRDDPRVTRVGRLLRRAGLDELPQLWNIARGEMSVVGPRPPLPEEVAEYDEVASQRLHARPGLTCTWQIERRFRSDITFEEWVAMDLAYLEGWTMAVDARLILGTLRAIARMTGE